jgi:hypothetical protein
MMRVTLLASRRRGVHRPKRVARVAGAEHTRRVNTDPFGDAEVPADPHRALELLERQASALYAAAAPKGMSPSGNERVYKKERRELEAVLAGLGVAMPFPWASLEECLAFYKATISGSGAYGRRKADIASRAAHTAEMLQRRIDDHAAGNVQAELTGLHGAAEDALADPSAIRLELTRIEDSIAEDPSAAIGKSKNLIEATAKAVLTELGQPVPNNESPAHLAALALKALGLDRQTVAAHYPIMGKILGQLNGIASSVADLRNAVGDGHGGSSALGLDLREGRLAARAAVAWSCFMIETLEERQRSGGTP